ncbi:MAG: tetratricopeptide repeat protein [Candidatus Hodarchaeales archaeon]|jgi:tetratricopeptide (TPR) repeat protein
MKYAEAQNDSLLLFYVGAGISEFLNLNEGLEIIEKAISQLEANKDWISLLDAGIPYVLILNNSENRLAFKNGYQRIKQVFQKELGADLKYQHLFIPVHLFAYNAKIEEIKLDPQEAIRITLESKNHLSSGLAYALLAKKDKEEEEYVEEYFEAAIKQYQSIDANCRLVIVYTNYADYLSSKSNHEKSSNLLAKAFSIVKEITRNREMGIGILNYPFLHKAWSLIEEGKLQEAKTAYQDFIKKYQSYESPSYKGSAEHNLAYIYFLESDDNSALKYAKNSISTISTLATENPKLIYGFQLYLAELLVEMNRLEDVPSILEEIDIDQLEECSKDYYNYIRGKYELNSHNIGKAKNIFLEALKDDKCCSKLRTPLVFALAEGYLHEFRLTENPKILQEAQKMVDESLEKISDVPNRAKGHCLKAILLSAQGRDEEAEQLLENLTSDSSKIIPRFQRLAEKLLENIRDTRIGRANISPISNIRDVLRYLQDAKTMIESQPR